MTPPRDDRTHLPLLLGAAALIAVVLVVVTWSVARLTPNGGSSAAATATPLVPTPTPRLVVGTPQVLAAWVQPDPSAPCDDCFGPQLTFTTAGPFDVVMVCNEEGVRDAENSTIFSYTLVDPNGSVVHQVEENCGPSPTPDLQTRTFVTPEARPAGTYTLHGQFFDGPQAKASLIVLAATLVPDTGAAAG
jgi:hypothetical protein